MTYKKVHNMSNNEEKGWPSVTNPPRAPIAGTIAELLFKRAVQHLPVQVRYPKGRRIGSNYTSAPSFEVVRPREFFSRLGKDTKIGFGEAYMAGDWKPGSDTDLADLLTPFAARLSTLVPKTLQRLRVVVDKRVPTEQKNTIEGSRENISSHYDLSNELFASFLDPTMSYSSAWFDESEPVATATKLKEAQLRKIDGVLDFAGVTSGTRMLEIGTGWGALAIRAAQRGAYVTTVTLSAEQCEFTSNEIARANLSGQVDVRLQDYREVEGTFDAIVSVEMLEAVGEEYWPTYFATIDQLLAPSGKACIQAITMEHKRVLATRRSFSWIQKYIFPGGIIPSLQSIDEILAKHTTLHVSAQRELGPHYARTLRLWRERFVSQWPQIRLLGFDETFRRMWEFYLAYCEAGFRANYLGVSQLQMRRK